MTVDERIKQLADLRAALVAEVDRVITAPVPESQSYYSLGTIGGGHFPVDPWARARSLEERVKWAERALELEGKREKDEGLRSLTTALDELRDALKGL